MAARGPRSEAVMIWPPMTMMVALAVFMPCLADRGHTDGE
jgi:hypothetical protein